MFLFVTIGQSPRDDVIPELMRIIGKDFEYEEVGLLDSEEALRDLKLLKIKDEFLVSRLRTGEEVTLPREWVVEKLRELNSKDDGILKILLCTDKFEIPNFILPADIMESFVRIVKPKKLGVVVPERDQIPMVRRKWEGFASDLKIVNFSPYTREKGDLPIIKDRDFILLDCIGYGEKDEKLLKNYTDGMVISARKLLANFLRNVII